MTKRYGDANHFLSIYSMDCAADFVANPERCITGSAPTLGQLKRYYGENMARTWLELQIIRLSELCGAKGKISNAQTAFCADVILSQYGYLKVTDLLLYFSNLIAGKYGYFYGTIDPQRMMAWTNQYLRERNKIYEQYESRIRAAEQAREEQERKGKTVTYDEYLQMKAEGKL